jgi:hypothetical protein
LTGKFGFDVFGGDHISIGVVAEVQFHARLKTPLQGRLIDRDRTLTVVHGRSGEVLLDVGTGVEWGGIAPLFALQMLMWPYQTGNERHNASDSELT